MKHVLKQMQYRFSVIYETLSTQRFAVDPDPLNFKTQKNYHAIQKGNLRIFVFKILFDHIFGSFSFLLDLPKKKLFLVARPKRGGKKEHFLKL